MKIFLDTANLEDIKKLHATGLVDGITTNPSHLAREKSDILKLLKEICEVMSLKPVSIEVTESEPEDVYKQAKKIAQIAPNVIVKIPCASQYFPVINKLVKESVNINVTLVFSLIQGILMGKLGVKYISPFVGRLDDIDFDGINLIKELRHAFDFYDFKTEILAASLRNVRHVHDAILSGADIATVPVSVFNTLGDHPLTAKGIAKFNEDWSKLGIKSFP